MAGRDRLSLLKEVAAFWEIRVRKMPDGGYAIANVVGANEYASGVTDNAFTNGAAVCALKYAVSAAEACGERSPRRMERYCGESALSLVWQRGDERA